MAVHAVIMAGGKGERLWPLSTADMPKQLHSFGTGRSLLRSTFERLEGITDASRVYVVTNSGIAGKVSGHLPELPAENILVEPVGRNTAPCIAYAALQISKKDPDAVMAVFPADHLVGDGEGFRKAITFGIDALAGRPELLVTLGMVPDHPETGYGYIAPGETLDSDGPFTLHRVLTFREKPDMKTAEEYISRGFLWNAGMFIWRVHTILEAFRRYLPLMYGLLGDMGAQGDVTKEEVDAFYSAVDPISIDYGVMEKASDVAVVPADFGWNDIGSWDALGKMLPRDGSGNVTQGDVLLEDSANNVVWAGDKKVVLIGVEDLVVVEGKNEILVCPRKQSQLVSLVSKKIAGS